MIVDPTSGVTFKTVPSGSSDGTASVCATNKPTAAKAARASINDIPINPVGTIASPGPSEIVNTTPEPFCARVVARGI